MEAGKDISHRIKGEGRKKELKQDMPKFNRVHSVSLIDRKLKRK